LEQAEQSSRPCIRGSREENSQYYAGEEHLAYNRFVRAAIDGSFRFSSIRINQALDITIDAKERLHEDNFLSYLQDQYELTRSAGRLSRQGLVTVREVDSKKGRPHSGLRPLERRVPHDAHGGSLRSAKGWPGAEDVAPFALPGLGVRLRQGAEKKKTSY
jgi:hypothetical protein